MGISSMNLWVMKYMNRDELVGRHDLTLPALLSSDDSNMVQNDLDYYLNDGSRNYMQHLADGEIIDLGSFSMG